MSICFLIIYISYFTVFINISTIFAEADRLIASIYFEEESPDTKGKRSG